MEMRREKELDDGESAAVTGVPEGEYMSDENTIRGNWTYKIDCVLALVGFTVGFGNIWRFPYLCYRNGGGAFLVPYFIMLVVAGIPLYFMELIVGQYSSLGPVTVWKLCPLFKGIGISTVVVVFAICTYYNTLIAYAIFYFFASMTSHLPWATCDNSWNTPACIETLSPAQSEPWFHEAENNTFYNVTTSSVSAQINLTLPTVSANQTKSPTEEYFENYMLSISAGIDEPGTVKWQLLLCLLLAWIINFLVLIKGIKSASKVVYVTATFPYIVLLILLIRGLTLPGSLEGIKFYIVPKWHMLRSPKVWGEAAVQIFYSLGPCWGGLITFASFNKFHNNILRDTLFCSLTCCGSSFLAGMVVFSVLGFMSHKANVPVDGIVRSGPGLAFVAYPEALAQMPIAPFWSILFFLMLITVGIDSQFSQIEMVVASISDEFPNTLRKHKTWFTLFICVVSFLAGVPQVTKGGIYMMYLVDWYVALYSFLLIGLLEVIVIAWIYGYQRLCDNVEVMLGKRPNIYFIITWCGLTPAAIVAICVFNATQYKTVTYNDYEYPTWAEVLGWFIALLPVIPIPGYMVFHFARHVGSVQGLMDTLSLPWTGETFRALCQPAPDWGPMMPQFRKEANLPPLTEVTIPLQGKETKEYQC